MRAIFRVINADGHTVALFNDIQVAMEYAESPLCVAPCVVEDVLLSVQHWQMLFPTRSKEA